MVYRRFAAALFCLTITSQAYAGAWLQPKGQVLAIGNATYYGTSRYFDQNGELQKQPRFNKYELQPYVEYGLFDWLTVGGSVYAQSVAQSGRSNYGLADPEFFLRTNVWNDATQTVSIQPLVKFGSRFAHDSSPRGGSESHDYELSVLYGRQMNILSDRDYLDASVGYRTRDRGLSDQVRMDAALGLSLTDTIQIIPAMRGIMATNPTDAAVYSENGELDYGVLKAEVTGIYHLNDRQWVQAGLFKPVMGVQTGDGYGLSVGFAQRF